MYNADKEPNLEIFLKTMREYSKMHLQTVQFTNFDKFYEMYKSFVANLNFKDLKQMFVSQGYNYFTASKRSVEAMQYSAEFFALHVRYDEFQMVATR